MSVLRASRLIAILPWALALLALFDVHFAVGQSRRPVVTVIADFNGDSEAARITETRNVLIADCNARPASIPARGPACLAVDIGATRPNASAVCDILLRVPVRFSQADRVGIYCYTKGPPVQIAFRIVDALGRLFETAAHAVKDPTRWVFVAADLAPSALRPLQPGDKLTWPIQILGFRLDVTQIGRQTFFLDDLLVEHTVQPHEQIAGHFTFDEPTHLYEPGTTIGALVTLENRSRRNTLRVSVELAWLRSDGTPVKTERRGGVNIPPSGVDYRSSKPIDFSLRINEPGLYRLVARVRAPGWPRPNTFSTTIAVTPSNRNLPRGRQVFFGLRSNLTREPLADQAIEIDLARRLGANLLALDVPWSALQPQPDRFMFQAVDKLVSSAFSLDMAVMIALTDPPAWLRAGDHDIARQQALLVEMLASRFRGRVRMFQLIGGQSAVDAERAHRLAHAAIAAAHPEISVLSAPLPIDHGAKPSVPPDLNADTDRSYAFQTIGDASDAASARIQFARSHELTWTDKHWWQHAAAPRAGPGNLQDAEDVLRQYVQAARTGVGGLIWFDLRDDDNDARRPDALRGLVRRDYSPKFSLLGYSATVGMLTGLRYAGPVAGAPPEFDSALFIGSERQLALLLPKVNRILPAVLAPVADAPGRIAAYDFQRVGKPTPVVQSSTFVYASSRPFFIELQLDHAEPDPQLKFAREPWLRVPATVLVEREALFEIVIRPPFPLRSSFLQVNVPDGSPLRSDLRVKTLRTKKGRTLKQPIRLTLDPKATFFEREQITLRLTLEGDILELPISVVRLHKILPFNRPSELDLPDRRLTTLLPPGDGAGTVQIHAGYRRNRLRFTFRIRDNSPVPISRPADGRPGGDELLFAIAAENSDSHVEVRIRPTGNGVALEPVHGTQPALLKNWRCTSKEGEDPAVQIIELSIPAAAFGRKRFSAGERFLTAARYLDDNGRSPARGEYRWGRGLDGHGKTDGFAWSELAPRP